MTDRIRRSHRFTMTPEHLTIDPRVGDRAHRLWCRIDRLAGAEASLDGTVREELSIEMNCSLASIDRALAELITAGWLQVDRQPGGESIYTLVVVPEKTVTKLIDDAREAREARWKGKRRQYAAATAARPVEERRHSRKTDDPVSSQVTGMGVVTSDATTRTAEGVVTSDDGVSSLVTTGVVTSDDRSSYRDLERFGENTLAAADAATRDEAAGVGETGGDALFGLPSGDQPTPRTGRSSRARPEPNPVQKHANDLCATWWDALPIKPSGPRAFPNVAALVAADITVGRSDEEISRALAACGVAVTRNRLDFLYEQQRRGPAGAPSSIRTQAYLSDTDTDRPFGMPA